MGRGFNFSYSQVILPKGEPEFSELLKTLRVGDTVSMIRYEHEFGFPEDGDSEFPSYPVARCPSNYGYVESSIQEDITYVVDSIDCDPELFHQTGLRGIALRDVRIPHDSHIATWIVTTDGYLRECEEFGITGRLSSIAKT